MEHAQREALELLVARFGEALLLKLVQAEGKHGWNGAWQRDGWQCDLQAQLLRHVEKGDPLDVAAYAAFAWHHGWSTASQADALPVEIVPVDQTVLGVGNPRANCFQACLSMISGLPLADCIDITDPNIRDDEWIAAVEGWALQHGWLFRTALRSPEGRPYIANGPTHDREGVHGVVCLNNEMVHDPHPSRAGIASVNWFGWLQPLGAGHG